MGKARARGKAAEGAKMAASGSIMDMFQARKRRRAVDARKGPAAAAAQARETGAQRAEAPRKALRVEEKKPAPKEPRVPAHKDREAVVDLSSEPAKRSPSTSSPTSSSAAAADAEPEVLVDSFAYRKELEKVEAQERGREDLPHATYATVHYEPRGVSEDTLQREYGRSPREIFNANVNNCKVTQYVLDTYAVPENFDRSLKYGPRSGICFEERLVSAYEQGLLAPKDPAKAPAKMCRECGTTGHFCWECPTLVA